MLTDDEIKKILKRVERDYGGPLDSGCAYTFAREIEDAIIEKQKQNCEVLKAETLIRLELAQEEDSENGHIRADRALCALLRSLGFGEVIEAFEKLSKYYA